VKARLDTTPAKSHQPLFQNPIVDITDAPASAPRGHDPSNGMSTFRSRYREAQELARRNAEAKAPARAPKRPSALAPLFDREDERKRREYREDQTRHFAEIAAYESDAVTSRLKNGFRHHFPQEVGGRVRMPFTEQGLRSESLNSIAARYFVTCLHKGGSLRSSMDKATLAVQTRSKLLALDYPWIEANKKVMSVIRIDCDRVFDSPGQCIAALREFVGYRIPCLPHLVTGDLLPDGRFSRPHLYFLLPAGHGVWNDPADARCRMDIVKFFHAVSLGLVAALAEIGADPCAPALTLRGKNPLSPYWHTICPNDDIWPTLSDYAGWVDMSVSREKLVRRAAALQSRHGIKGSNVLFDALRQEAFSILREWHFKTDPRGRGTKGRIADELHQVLVTKIAGIGDGLTEHQAGLIVAKVSDYAAGAWDASKVETSRKFRCRLPEATENMKTQAKRQAAGAAYAATAKAARALKALADAYERLRAGDQPLTQTAVASEAGIHRRTAVRRWSEVLEAVGGRGEGCDNRCKDKKVAPAPAVLHVRDTADQSRATPEPLPVRQDGIAKLLSLVPSQREISEAGTTVDAGKTFFGQQTIGQQDAQYREVEVDDMAEIEAQEAWLASLECGLPCDPPEPDDAWLEWRTAA